MKVIGVIPARLESTRLRHKVLADLCGRPVIQHVYERAKQARSLDEVLVACDDEAIRRVVQKFKGKAVLTSKDHRTGTERLAEVVNDMDVDLVVNIQGDEPFISPLVIDELVGLMQKKPAKEMGTVVKKSTSWPDFKNPDIVKAVVDESMRVVYFSRAAIPYYLKKGDCFYKHIGLYAYTKDFLFMFKKYPASFLERNEKLEQLRALENGHLIWSIETDEESIGIDTPDDLEKAREQLKRTVAKA